MSHLSNRNAIITGASQGLGKEIASAYLRAGANVLICSRNEQELNATREELLSAGFGPDRLVARVADVSRADDVASVTSAALTQWNKVDVLVNNAGVYGPMGRSDGVDWNEWTRTIEINLYGSVLPARALLPHFKERRYGKIVQISGGGATTPFPSITAYAASKAAVVRFAESLAQEVLEYGIDVNALAPGALQTRMLDQVIESGPDAVGKAYYERMLKIKEEGGTPLHRGAALAVFLGSSASDGLTGRLISAAWDSWESLPERIDEINASDIYTLRRITAADRGKAWDK